MIERYSYPEMKKIWEDKNKYETWLKVELLACEAMFASGRMDEDTLTFIQKNAKYSIKRIEEIEKVTRHDVLAFTTAVGEHLESFSSYFHQGLTSSDVLDTSLAIRLKQSAEIIIKDLEQVLHVIREKALEHKNTVMIGRTHGVHAEPITFGFKLINWYSEMTRNMERMKIAMEDISYGKISGAVGTFAHIEPFTEEYICSKLGLKPAAVSNQILQRDRHASYLTVLAIIGSSLEKFATEIRGMQRTEIYEAEEQFAKGQKGSSAMPHKRNPIICERICGLSRVLRANALVAMENINLWQERDISHSSAERVIIPDSAILMDYMLKKFAILIEKLNVYTENMKKNLETTRGLIYSQRVMLKLTTKGLSREQAYRIVQGISMKVWKGDTDFKSLLLKNKEARDYLNEEEINECFDYNNYLQHIDYIFSRVLG